MKLVIMLYFKMKTDKLYYSIKNHTKQRTTVAVMSLRYPDFWVSVLFWGGVVNTVIRLGETKLQHRASPRYLLLVTQELKPLTSVWIYDNKKRPSQTTFKGTTKTTCQNSPEGGGCWEG